MLSLRQFSGRISFVPAPGFEAYGEPTRYNGEFASTHSINPGQEQPVKAEQYSYQGPDVDLTNLEWRTINGPFISVWLHNVPWGGDNTMAAPDAKVCLSCACNSMLHLLFSTSFSLSYIINQHTIIHVFAFPWSLIQQNLGIVLLNDMEIGEIQVLHSYCAWETRFIRCVCMCFLEFQLSHMLN